MSYLSSSFIDNHKWAIKGLLWGRISAENVAMFWNLSVTFFYLGLIVVQKTSCGFSLLGVFYISFFKCRQQFRFSFVLGQKDITIFFCYSHFTEMYFLKRCSLWTLWNISLFWLSENLWCFSCVSGDPDKGHFYLHFEPEKNRIFNNIFALWILYWNSLDGANIRPQVNRSSESPQRWQGKRVCQCTDKYQQPILLRAILSSLLLSPIFLTTGLGRTTAGGLTKAAFMFCTRISSDTSGTG